jgi:hypothetical protein
MRASPSDPEPGSRAIASAQRRRQAATRELRVEVVFDGVDERRAQDVAAEMIARAHELANRPEHECDVDVSVQLCPGGGAGDTGEAVLAPVAGPADAGGVPTDGHLAPRTTSAGQNAAAR